MGENKVQQAYNLKLIADKFNKLSDYEQYVSKNKDFLERIYQGCLERAKDGRYSTSIFVTYRYNDPDKNHLIKYFENLYYKVELYEPGLIKGEKKEPTEEELKIAPFRQYALMLRWDQ